LNATDLTPATALVPALARQFAAMAPNQGGRFISLLSEATYGTLTTPTMIPIAEALAKSGRLENVEAFVPDLQAARHAMKALIADIQAHPERLAAAVGPAIWLQHPTQKASQAADAGLLTFDLNTAEAEQLSLLPGFDADTVKLTLRRRRRDGDFGSLDDFVARIGIAPDLARTLQAMAHACARSATFVRQ
jgi:DNA uptake protein ComE-like DNA-binding protein